MTQLDALQGIDFTDPDVMAGGNPMELLALLRHEAPIWWNAQSTEDTGFFNDNGFWFVTRQSDVREVSTRPDVFSAALKTVVPTLPKSRDTGELEAARTVLLNMDPPEHTHLRRIVQRGFTPRAVQALKEALSVRAEKIVAEAKDGGKGDFVTEVASELPLQAIAELVGVPQEDRAKIFTWSNQLVGDQDPAVGGDPTTAAAEIIAYSMMLAEQRKADPKQDIISMLVAAELEDGNLTSDEFGFFVLVLMVAGSETTRNALTHGMMAFFDNPEQWELYKAERPDTAADELVRWASPVMMFQRAALRDTSIGGVEVKAGDRVVMSYLSANFDPEVFDDPEKFDILRSPNPHVGFGGGGPHFCLGANLARLELNLMLAAIADQMPDISPAGMPVKLRSSWLNSVMSLPVSYV